MQPEVAAFTDTYLPTVNGVTYTVAAWRDRWRDCGGRMDVVYPRARNYDPAAGEHPVRSISFPFYEGYRLGVPQTPAAVDDVDVVHAHTPFGVGLAGLRLARRNGLPFVVSYHTPTGEYAEYLVSNGRTAGAIQRVSERYERWFLDHADAVIAPSETTAEHVRERIDVTAPVTVVPNGVDVSRFRPVDPGAFRRRYGLDVDRPLVGYTGRHGHEKRLHDLVDAAAGLDVTVVLGGDGPARESLEARAERIDADVRFLGFLPRGDLPAFYAALDVFAFPSPVETQGLVALEANACGTPVVGADEGALASTVREGETGVHFETGDVESLRDAIERVLADRDRLSESCLDYRKNISVSRAIDRLDDVYGRVLA